METLEEEDQQHSTKKKKTDDLRLAKNIVPGEIVEEILSRLPVKSILRFRSVSKPWLSHISDPSFTGLQFARATTARLTGLFMFASDPSTRKLHLFSAEAYDGAPVNHILTIDDAGDFSSGFSEAEHLNGLVLFTSVEKFPDDYRDAYAIVVNPSTRKFFKLSDPCTDSEQGRISYLFGFDDSTNEHKVLIFREFNDDPGGFRLEIMIFSLSNYSWRKIDVEPPVGLSWDDMSLSYAHHYYARRVCVNSVVHLLLDSHDILAFDLRIEKLSIIKAPQGVLPDDDEIACDYYLTKFNGYLGLVYVYRLERNKEACIWILQDYENRVWEKIIITYPMPWGRFGCPCPEESINVDEIIFRVENLMSALVYNKKSRCFRSLHFTPGRQFPTSGGLQLKFIRLYVESMLPL